MLPIAGAFLAYQAARGEGWSQEEAMGYASVAVVDGDLVVDAALLSQRAFLHAAEAFAQGYEAAALGYLNDALGQTECVRGHEPGINNLGPRMDVIFRRGGTVKAGDVGQFLGP